MTERKCASPQLGKETNAMQPECVAEKAGWRRRAFPENKEEAGGGMQQRWEAQWQEFLQTLQAPHSAWGTPHPSEAAPWDDAKAFLASFEQVAGACQWPRGEWVTRLMPALSGEAQQACSFLGDGDKEDYGKLKAAILRGDALKRETQRQHFRRFCCPELEDPRKMYVQLQELCCQWLKPERHTKEQILELLVLEQFVASLPVDVQSWVRAGGPDSCAQAVALLEDFLLSQGEVKTRTWQEVGMESLEMKAEPLNTAQGAVYNEARQNGDGEISFPGSAIQCPSHPGSSLPPEGQEMAKGPMNLEETGVSLHIVEQSPTQPGHQTMFWKILQENHGNVDFMGGLLVPKSELCTRSQKEDELVLQFPLKSAKFQGQDSGDGKETTFEMDNFQCRGGEIQETPKTVSSVTLRNASVSAEIQEQIYKSKGQPERTSVAEQNEFNTFSEIPIATQSETTIHTGPKIPLASRYGRPYRYKAGLGVSHIEDDPSESESESCGWGENQKINTRDKLSRKNIQQLNDLSKHQSSNTRERTWECFECGKLFSCRANLRAHQKIHVGKRPHKCPNCEKVFTRKVTMERHRRLHTGERPYACPECGKSFSRKDKLFTHHQRHYIKHRQSLYWARSDTSGLGCPLHTST